MIRENIKFIENETGLRVILDTNRVPENKRMQAIPGKPAIYIA